MSTPSPSPDTCPDSTTVELLLITLTLVTSTILALVPSHRDRALDRALPPTVFLTYLPVLLALGSLALAFVALLLGWLSRISLDALAAVVFALIPALVQMPLDAFFHAYFRYRMQRHRSLKLTTSTFRYIRLGHPCGSADPLYREFREKFCDESCKARIWIRSLPQPQHTLFTLSCFRNPEPKPVIRWHGEVKDHTRHCIVAQDLRPGLKAWWWNSVVSATWLLANPSLARVASRDAMFHVLCLVTDIIAIGDLILDVRRSFIKSQISGNKGVRRATSATPRFVCNAITTRLALEWGSISPDITKSDYNYPKDEPEEYGLLFFVLTEKSRVFETANLPSDPPPLPKTTNLSSDPPPHPDSSHSPPHSTICMDTEPPAENLNAAAKLRRAFHHVSTSCRVSAQEIMDDLEKFDLDEAQFRSHLEDHVDRWLKSWGCSEESLEGPAAPVVEPSVTANSSTS